MYVPNESLGWDGNVSHNIYNGNGPPLQALSALESFNVDVDLLSRLKGAHSSFNYFSYENIDRKKRHLIKKPSDGLFRYHNHVVLPRPAIVVVKALLIEYHENVGHSNHRRLLACILQRFFYWDKMPCNCNSHT